MIRTCIFAVLCSGCSLLGPRGPGSVEGPGDAGFKAESGLFIELVASAESSYPEGDRSLLVVLADIPDLCIEHTRFLSAIVEAETAAEASEAYALMPETYRMWSLELHVPAEDVDLGDVSFVGVPWEEYADDAYETAGVGKHYLFHPSTSDIEAGGWVTQQYTDEGAAVVEDYDAEARLAGEYEGSGVEEDGTSSGDLSIRFDVEPCPGAAQYYVL